MYYVHKYGLVYVNFVQKVWSVRIDSPFTFGDGDVYTTKLNMDTAIMLEDAVRDYGFVKDTKISTNYDYDEDEYDVNYVVALTDRYLIYFDDNGKVSLVAR